MSAPARAAALSPVLGVQVADGEDVLLAAFLEGFTPPVPMTVSEWADEHRILPRKGSSEPGEWRTERTPYLREIMDCLSVDHPAQRVAVMKATQVGGTECGNNWVGYVIDHAPGPMMVVQPTVDIAQRWSRQRVAPMIEECDVLRLRVQPARSRDSGNTTLLKEFPGGVLVVAGANSAAPLRSMPVRYLMLDEIDAYPGDVDGEGSPVELAERRTSTFPRRKVFLISTPTLAEASPIEREWLRSDQRRYHMPCPHCSESLVLRDEQLTDDGQYLCEHCGQLIEEHHKTAMLAAGEWRPTHPERTTRGYHLNSLYAPIGLGYTWAEIAAKRAEAREDPGLLKTYVNTILGLPYEDLANRVEPDELAERREDWTMRTVPRGCLLVTVGVDVQIDRLAVLVCGWGRGESCWLLDRVDLPGDPTHPETWASLDDYLKYPILNRCGVSLTPRLVAVDSGNWTHEVYQFVRGRRGVIAIKGMNTAGKPVIGRPRHQDVNIRGRVVRQGVALWPIGTDTAKQTLIQRLQGDAAATEVEQRRIHFPADMSTEHLGELASERWDATRQRWVPVQGRRNETLDCLVYAYAAACHPSIRLHTLRDPDWERIAAQVEPATMDLFEAPDTATAPERDAGVPRGTALATDDEDQTQAKDPFAPIPIARD